MCLWFNMWTEYPELAHASINWSVVTKSKLGHVMWHTENRYKLVMSPSKYNLGNLITSSSYSKCWFDVIHVLSINLLKFWKDKDECTLHFLLHFFWTYHAMSFCLGVSFKNTLKSPKSAHVSMSPSILLLLFLKQSLICQISTLDRRQNWTLAFEIVANQAFRSRTRSSPAKTVTKRLFTDVDGGTTGSKDATDSAAAPRYLFPCTSRLSMNA